MIAIAHMILWVRWAEKSYFGPQQVDNLLGTGYDYPDLPGLGNNNEKLGLPERLSTGI